MRVPTFACFGVCGVLALAGCELGAATQATVPYDPHVAHPDAREVAANPCKYGELRGCVLRCQAQEPGSCNAVGVILEYGHGSPSDVAVASSFYERACASEYAPGCTNLAWLYALGRGVPKDEGQSMALFTRAYEASKLACRRGDMSGCLMAGELLFEGHTTERGPATEAEAISFFRAACRGGEAKGCARLAEAE